ncbi:transglutaminase-like cysteine peptidase [Hoeflea sp. J2-29]|uniref:Transglutaminase-like cysteine peptidase n=1 Tax=Hoeflea ulvae TaxID=2983764 RepID=A0ABT3YGS8_9HYPH|nr:transglutaminase-like cysteine peptidase [Hoeflea ulvae]MCY0095108.1 transglutaminase-like cysteine peptidase [Hoeflea ulvae]
MQSIGSITAACGLAVAFSTAAFATPTNLVPTGKTNPPIGHYEFCKSYPSECRSLGTDRGAMTLTRERWAQMLKVNASVNQGIRPDTDLNIYGVDELWSYPRTVGDCEDYVLLKRHMLIEKGFSPSDLLITVVLQPNGDGHAVLTVRTDYGDYILDNMRGDVRLWSETGYTFVKRQSSEHAARWTKLGPGSASSVGAVNY